jgi:hypothetical protein
MICYRPQWANPYPETGPNGERYRYEPGRIPLPSIAVPGSPGLTAGAIAAFGTIDNIPVAIPREFDFILCAIACDVPAQQYQWGMRIRDCYGHELMNDYMPAELWGLPGGVGPDRAGSWDPVFEPPLFCPAGGFLIVAFKSFSNVLNVLVPDTEFKGYKRIREC